MANTRTAKKMVRKIVKRTALNRSRRARVRTFVKKFHEAAASEDTEAISSAFRNVESELMRAVSKGVLHKNTGSRIVSRLSAHAKRLANS